MAEQLIESKNDIFPPGTMIPKPKRATVIYSASGEPLYKCPYCGDIADAENCDCLGAEDGCLFCNTCNREFEAW